MPDRVKAAAFDMLGSRLRTPGSLPPFEAVDLFAGAGTLGLEALSRGAAFCYFFERHPQTLQTLRANIDALEASNLARVVPADAWRSPFARLPDDCRVGLVLLDPPYRDATDPGSDGRVWRFLRESAGCERLDDAALILLHHPGEVDFGSGAPEGWSVVAQRRYGTNGLTVFERTAPEPGEG